MTVADGEPSPARPRGRRLAVDVGSVRIGVAACDPDGMLATPVETVPRVGDGRDLARIAALVDEYDAVEVIVGLPTTLRGDHGPAAQTATSFAEALRRRVGDVPVTLHDERMTTALASRSLRAGGRSSKQQRAIIDQAAAVEILQSWLDRHLRRPVVGDPGAADR
ncbi:Holliday junction resolvase RuvX [Williamsia serinedens]|uniref:Putative pre-16S rRNA nuclease n=1 Tax=Williamsia serinedens TaxID=391736 RepID=A0ABT1GXN3_9NOCA|nr:Holliday junction resolvase RuvX [Williamsia serinedens]MCP2159160.1 putative holliday junction resolvase [Williamsia serinedens]